MDEILSKLKGLNPGNPGASKAAITTLEKSLRIKLPPELALLYADRDGETDLQKLPWRLMPVSEVSQVNSSLSNEKILPPEIRLFWTDDEGNYAGLYVDGPLIGKVCFFDHEERDFSPRFSSLSNLLQAMLAAAQQGRTDWRDLPSDFSAPAPADTGPLAALRERFANEKAERKRRQLAFDIIALAQPSEILPFLDDADLWIQERAAETLGKRRYEAAIPALVKVAERETTRIHNARIGAIIGLGHMKSAPSLDALLALAKKIPPGFHNYIFKALELHGCPTKFDNSQWKYQFQNEWRTL